jgi:DNA-binding transcriptional LysR family regulator
MIIMMTMREVNLRGIDLNLLVALEALIEEANVTRAAGRAGMSQPAMSRALGRLRHLLGDQVLVRAAAGFQRTARAETLRPRLAGALAEIRGMIADEPFVPALYSGQWVIASTDHQTILLLPRLMARLSREMPRVDVRVVPLTNDARDRLLGGEIDLAFGVTETEVAPQLRRQALYRDRFVTLLRQGHPALADWSLARFAALDHVLVTIMDDGKGAMDAVLEAQGMSRRIALRLPHFVAAIGIVATSDLAVTLPFSIASRFAQEFRLAIVETPLSRPPFEVVSIWSEVVDRDPAARHLRAIVREEARQIPGVLPM